MNESFNPQDGNCQVPAHHHLHCGGWAADNVHTDTFSMSISIEIEKFTRSQGK